MNYNSVCEKVCLFNCETKLEPVSEWGRHAIRKNLHKNVRKQESTTNQEEKTRDYQRKTEKNDILGKIILSAHKVRS